MTEKEINLYVLAVQEIQEGKLRACYFTSHKIHKKAMQLLVKGISMRDQLRDNGTNKQLADKALKIADQYEAILQQHLKPFVPGKTNMATVAGLMIAADGFEYLRSCLRFKDDKCNQT